MELVNKEIEDYASTCTPQVDPIFDELERETYLSTSSPQMLTGKVEGKLLRLLVAITGAKVVVDVGTFTGNSSLMMASVLPDDGVVYTLDRDERSVAIAKRYFARAFFGKKIRPILGDARETIRNIPAPIDMAFIDADKTSYDVYYEVMLDKLRPGGLLVLDNMLWSGQVLDPQDEEARAIDSLNRKIAKDVRVDSLLLTIRDGIVVARKRQS